MSTAHSANYSCAPSTLHTGPDSGFPCPSTTYQCGALTVTPFFFIIKKKVGEWTDIKSRTRRRVMLLFTFIRPLFRSTIQSRPILRLPTSSLAFFRRRNLKQCTWNSFNAHRPRAGFGGEQIRVSKFVLSRERQLHDQRSSTSIPPSRDKATSVARRRFRLASIKQPVYSDVVSAKPQHCDQGSLRSFSPSRVIVFSVTRRH